MARTVPEEYVTKDITDLAVRISVTVRTKQSATGSKDALQVKLKMIRK